MTPIDSLNCESCPTGRLADRLAEVAAGAGVALITSGTAQAGATLAFALDARDLSPQGYRLDITATGSPSASRVSIAIAAPDEPGAYYALVSLGQLIARTNTGLAIRQASINDGPAFRRRGVILDMPLPASTAGRATLLERIRLGAAYKMNLVWPANAALDDSIMAREVVDYCNAHYIEVMNAIGYQNLLTTMPRDDLTRLIRSYYDRGVRSFSFNWDDIRQSSDPVALANSHAAVLDDIVRFLATLDDEVNLRVTLPPYGGVPGRNLMGVELHTASNGTGEAYLAAIRTRIPSAAEVFWTGDGGVYSAQVTADGARAYSDAAGHPVALWDNDAGHYGRDRLPLRGRAADLPSVVQTYMGNMTGAPTWTAESGQLALLTLLDYTWNAAAYEPDDAARRAGLRLRRA